MTDTMRTKGGYAIRPLELHAVSQHKADVYRFVFKDSGWVIFTVCDETGELSVQSDWGCWGHRWNPDHLGPSHDGSLTHFIPRANPGYLANKLSYSMPQETREVHCEQATEDGIRGRILITRRELEISKDEARELWEQADTVMDAYADGGPEHAYLNMGQELCDILGEPWEFFETEEAPTLVILRERLLPFLISHLRKKGENDAVERQRASNQG